MTSSRKVGNRFGYNKKETKENLNSGNKLEELLNKLIKRGWEPRGNKKEIGKFIVRKRGRSIERPQSQYMIYFYDKDDYCFMAYSLRELVSKESGLWQFCVENKLVKEDCSSIELKIMSEGYGLLTDSSYQFWLMMCVLKDESELEEFLIDNINI